MVFDVEGRVLFDQVFGGIGSSVVDNNKFGQFPSKRFYKTVDTTLNQVVAIVDRNDDGDSIKVRLLHR